MGYRSKSTKGVDFRGWSVGGAGIQGVMVPGSPCLSAACLGFWILAIFQDAIEN